MTRIIFDLDGTLLKQPTYPPQTAALWKAVRLVHDLALEELKGLEIERHGKTDMQVARELLALVRPGEKFDRVSTEIQYVAEFFANCPKYLEVEVRPGTSNALGILDAQGHDLVLATGNCLMVALLKLKRAGLFQFFTVEHGGYGLSEHREQVLRMAMEDELDAIYVCDTARDVAEAEKLNLRTIAITSKEQSREDLASAVLVIEGMSELVEAVAWLG